MIPSSHPISTPPSFVGVAASAAAGSASSHPVTERARFPIRQDPAYCSQYLRDIHAIFSEKIREAVAGGGKEKEFIYGPIHYDYFDTRFFLEIEGRRQSPTAAGGFGRDPVSEPQVSFNRLLFDVVEETIHEANNATFIEFDAEKPRDLQGLSLADRTTKLPISLGNFMSRIEGAVLRVCSSRVPDQQSVTAGVYFARSAEAKLRAEDAIAFQWVESIKQMVDALAIEEFGKWVAHPNLSQRLYEELLVLDPEGNGALVAAFQTLANYCSQLEELPIGSEGIFGLVGEIYAIRDRIIASMPTLGLDPHMEKLSIRECNDLIEKAIKKHRVPQAASSLEAAETPSSLDSARGAQSGSVAESQEVSPFPIASCLEGADLTEPPELPEVKAEKTVP